MSSPSTQKISPRHSRTLLAALAALVIVCGGFFAWQHWRAPAAKAASTTPAAIPVTVAAVEKADFPVYLKGLGVVQPFNTVTVKSRVDGAVTKIGFKQGQMVKEGDMIAEIDPRPYQAALDQAEAKKAQDESDLANARLDLARYTELAKQNFATRQQLDTQNARVSSLESQIKGDEGAIDNARTQVGYTTIRAPIAGRTGFRLVDLGNNVHASDTTGIVTIVQLQPISVVLTAPESEVVAINKALANGDIEVIAQSSDGLKTLATGTLDLVNNEVDQAAGTIRMKAQFTNKDNVLWPGLSVSTLLLVETLRDVAVVPQDAVEHGQSGLFVYVVGGDNKVDVKPIKVSQRGNGKAVVAEGLAPGEKVVVSGQSRLQKGTLIQPRDAGVAAPKPRQVAAKPGAAATQDPTTQENGD